MSLTTSPTIKALHEIEDITAEMVLLLRSTGFRAAASGYANALAARIHEAQLADNAVRADLQRVTKG